MRVLVVGGGIIGASCAAFLAERGAHVTVMDAGKPRFGTSLANAGHIVVSHSVPMAAPGMVRQGFRSLLSRDGAFAVAARPGRGTLGWLLGFARKCSPANVAALQPGMDQVLHRSAELLRADPDIAVTSTGLWQVFTSSEDRAAAEAAHLRHYGVQVRDVPEDELRAEPGLTDNVRAAIELTEDFGVDPAALWLRMRRRGEQAGAHWQEVVVPDLREVDADVVVLAAGAWSPATARTLGVDLPIRAAKGYSVTISNVEQTPTRAMLLMDQRTALNPLPGDDSKRLRLSARYEITQADDRDIAHHRIGALINRARQAVRLPADVGDVEPWAGVRPASIDGAPYIGFLPQRLRTPVLVATGHGMIGTAMAVGTADLVSRLAFDEPVSDAESHLGPARLFT
jgi:D-amino-acid dehydrogenase